MVKRRDKRLISFEEVRGMPPHQVVKFHLEVKVEKHQEYIIPWVCELLQRKNIIKDYYIVVNNGLCLNTHFLSFCIILMNNADS